MNIIKNQHAFTLLEIMISLTILSVAIGSLVLSNIEASKNQAYLRDKTFALMIAQNTLNEIRIGVKSINQSQDIKFANTEWNVTTEQIKTHHPSIQKVRVSISNHTFKNLLNVESTLRVDK